MAYYKNRIHKEVSSFEFATNNYTISDDIYSQYKQLKSLSHNVTDVLMTYNNESSHDTKKMESGVDLILTFYDACGSYMIILLDEIFKNPLENKRELFSLINKTFKIFFVFDVMKHRHPSFFNGFARYRDDGDSAVNDRFAILTALAMPMAHCFVSYFSSEEVEIHAPSKLIRRNSIYLDENKKEHLYKLGCITCKYDYEYGRIFFAGLFNRFFHSGYFVDHIERLNRQKGAYYVAIAEYH